MRVTIEYQNFNPGWPYSICHSTLDMKTQKQKTAGAVRQVDASNRIYVHTVMHCCLPTDLCYPIQRMHMFYRFSSATFLCNIKRITLIMTIYTKSLESNSRTDGQGCGVVSGFWFPAFTCTSEFGRYQKY